MESRIAGELLYESEATLRMVDTVLDELRIADAEPIPGPRLAILDDCDEPSSDFGFPTESCARGYWQVQELLDGVRNSREALQALGTDGSERAGTSLLDGDVSGLDRALALVDRLDTLVDEGPDERHALHDNLRRELLGLLDSVVRESGMSERLSVVTLQLAEAEARLTRLGHLFATQS